MNYDTMIKRTILICEWRDYEMRPQAVLSYTTNKKIKPMHHTLFYFDTNEYTVYRLFINRWYCFT